MLVYSESSNILRHVEFISYTGRWPHLCHGVLTLRINDEEVKFGHDITKYQSFETDGNFPEFWDTGGCIKSHHSKICHGEWKIFVDRLPEKFREYANEIDEVFNDNVEYGCCGGCK